MDISLCTLDNVWFDAWQLAPNYPDFCEGLWISWLVTAIRYNKGPEVPKMKRDPMTYTIRDEVKLYLGKIEIIPTFCNGFAEFHGYFADSHQSEEFRKFQHKFKVFSRKNSLKFTHTRTSI